MRRSDISSRSAHRLFSFARREDGSRGGRGKKAEKKKMQYIEAIYKHLVSIDNALHSGNSEEQTD